MSTEPSPVMTITNVIENITQPQALQSFYDKKVTVFLHRTEKDAGTDIQLPPVFPFMRLYDLKLAIYKHLKDSPLTKGLKLYPGYQFLSFSRVAGTRSAVDFQWFIPGKKSPILLAKPFDLKKTKQIAVDFVDENGAARNLTLTDTSKLLVQNLKMDQLSYKLFLNYLLV